MKTSRLVMVAGASATMLAIGWRAGTAPFPSLVVADDPIGGAPASGSVVDPSPSGPVPTGESSTGSNPAGPSGTFVGNAVDTAFGTLQVQIVVADGEIADVQPLALGFTDSKSRQINAAAVPILEQRVLTAQSADVSYVSGASYTSQGYLASVASAIVKAGI
ncbi:MAG: FMN-binding protein [Demequinaceae bacterium]|nr:FMN-binding protein [Demequinaceae bacterium]